MELMSVKCPNCGANVYLEGNKTRGFCSNCGGQIIINDGIQRTIDQTKEYELDMKTRQFNEAVKRIEREHVALIKAVPWKIAVIIAMVIFAIVGMNSGIQPLAIIAAFSLYGLFFFGMFFFISLIEIGSKNDKIEKVRQKIFDEPQPAVKIGFWKNKKKDD